MSDKYRVEVINVNLDVVKHAQHHFESEEDVAIHLYDFTEDESNTYIVCFDGNNDVSFIVENIDNQANLLEGEKVEIALAEFRRLKEKANELELVQESNFHNAEKSNETINIEEFLESGNAQDNAEVNTTKSSLSELVDDGGQALNESKDDIEMDIDVNEFLGSGTGGSVSEPGISSTSALSGLTSADDDRAQIVNNPESGAVPGNNMLTGLNKGVHNPQLEGHQSPQIDFGNTVPPKQTAAVSPNLSLFGGNVGGGYKALRELTNSEGENGKKTSKIGSAIAGIANTYRELKNWREYTKTPTPAIESFTNQSEARLTDAVAKLNTLPCIAEYNDIVNDENATQGEIEEKIKSIDKADFIETVKDIESEIEVLSQLRESAAERVNEEDFKEHFDSLESVIKNAKDSVSVGAKEFDEKVCDGVLAKIFENISKRLEMVFKKVKSLFSTKGQDNDATNSPSPSA